MKHSHLLFFLIPIFFLGCKASPTHTAVRVPDDEDTIMLVGTASLDSLNADPFVSWYETNREGYSPDSELLAQLRPLLKDIKIVLIMGTWCKDSRREVPRFTAILDDVKYPLEDVEVIAVDRNKETPEKFEQGLELIQVPTFIFYKDQQELGRIVEFPINTLESDMLAILTGQPYRHAYDWD
jgi:thiol-disulfide isomerase/thioredoxin